jgi:hypothetical protein
VRLRLRAIPAGLGTALAVLAVAAPSASATTATATISAGGLALTTSPPRLASPASPRPDYAVTAIQRLDVSDATGSAAGWSITATSTGEETPVSVFVTPTANCGGATACALPAVSAPLSEGVDDTTSRAIKLLTVPGSTGRPIDSVTLVWTLAMPPSGYLAAHAAVWTVSLITGP